MPYVIGLDVGGTFTDSVCSDGMNIWRAKFPTNPAQFKDGVIGGCELLAQQLGVPTSQLLSETARFGLGTTAVTNVLATQRGRTVGLITTAGAEYHFHAMRNHREVVDGWLVNPWNPVDPAAVRGVNERIDRSGTVVSPLDEAEIEAAARALVEQHGVNAFAISFLWSFRNPDHEARAAAVVSRMYPDLPVLSGAALNPVMREYERTTLAVLNAFAFDALDGIDALEQDLRDLGLTVPLLLLHSGGGAMTVAEARATPMALASSGPAAGAIAAAEIAAVAGFPNALCCDMGGTSIDVAVVTNGVPERRLTAEVGGMVIGQSAVDVESIGAGGGSIAWRDQRGLLRVGPQSARANPGPVCYGRGGTEPTVTDAMVLLGYIDPTTFMGGRMTLDVEAARAACARLGEGIGISAMETARGIREIALAEMGKALRARITSGGLDVRSFGIVAFGGSGSLFATAMAQELDLAWTLTPQIASVLSAYGAATADIQRERRAAVNMLLPFEPEVLAAQIDGLRAQSIADLDAQGVGPQLQRLRCEAEMRFYQQRSSIRLAVDDLETLVVDDLKQRFHQAYAAQYGASGMKVGTPVELSCMHVTGIGETVRARLPLDTAHVDEGSVPPVIGERAIYTARDEVTAVPVFDAAALRIGHVVQGPALLDTVDTTLWAPPGSRVTAVAGGSLLTTFKD